ncbi:MAG: hypothetical protein IJ650_04520 [Paludibacteraceae bacterium]|nr:hypothetical protein [Paludibacteraceae bacterium]
MQLVVIAEEQERQLAEKYFPGISVLVTGVGALNIMKSLRDIPLDTEIFNIGHAGSSNFEIGTMIEVTEVRLNHPNVQYPEPEFHLSPIPQQEYDEPRQTYRKSVCYTGVDFVLQSDYKDCVFDMELAFICGMGFSTVHSLKHVSDNLSLHDYRKVGAGV